MLIAHAHAFLGKLWVWMCNIEEARWNGVKILIPKHIRKSKNELLEQISAKNPYVTFFLGHPVHYLDYLHFADYPDYLNYLKFRNETKKFFGVTKLPCVLWGVGNLVIWHISIMILWMVVVTKWPCVYWVVGNLVIYSSFRQFPRLPKLPKLPYKSDLFFRKMKCGPYRAPTAPKWI